MELFAHMVLVTFSVFIIIYASPGSSLFSWHPTCMVLAASLWTEAIIIFRRPKPSLRINIHLALNGAAITFAILGFLAIYQHKEQNKKPHFASSIHALVGSITMVLVIIQTIGGNFANLSGMLSKVFPFIKPSLVKWGHRLSGGLVISAVYATLFLAMGSIWFRAIVQQYLIWIGIALALLYPYLYAVFYANFSSGRGKATKAEN